MSSSVNGSNPSSNGDGASRIDKKELYGEYLRNQRWQNDLHRQAAHKALDIPDEDVGIDARNQSQTQTGIGTLGAVALAAITTLSPLAGIVAWQAMQPDPPAIVQPPAVVQPAPVQPAPLPAQPGPADSDYEVRFYDTAGNLIPVPHISAKPKEN